jgi:hypothetical protein
MPGIVGRPTVWDHQLVDCADQESLRQRLRDLGQSGWQAGGVTVDGGRWLVLVKRCCSILPENGRSRYG